MRSKTLLFCLWLALPALASAQSSVPEIQFDSVPDFFKLPANMYFGEVAGIAVNSKKHVFVLSRGNTSGPAYGAAAAQLLEFDSGGKFVREIGRNLYAWSFAHAVRVDRYDNIWVADKGSDVVVRFDPQGRVTRVFGRKVEASDEGAHPLEHPKPPLPAIKGLFGQPTVVNNVVTLSSIPIIGGLFGSTSRSTTDSEFFLFLTPHIIASDVEADSLTRPLQKLAPPDSAY